MDNESAKKIAELVKKIGKLVEMINDIKTTKVNEIKLINGHSKEFEGIHRDNKSIFNGEELIKKVSNVIITELEKDLKILKDELEKI